MTTQTWWFLLPTIYIGFPSFSQVTLIPDEAEDMWHTYNLLQVGDSLRASTIRSASFPLNHTNLSFSSFGLSCLISEILPICLMMKIIWCHNQESADGVLHGQCGQFTCAHHTDFMCGDDRLWFPGLSAQSQRNKYPGEPVCEGQCAVLMV